MHHKLIRVSSEPDLNNNGLLVIGGGVIGINIAQALRRRYAGSTVTLQLVAFPFSGYVCQRIQQVVH